MVAERRDIVFSGGDASCGGWFFLPVGTTSAAPRRPAPGARSRPIASAPP